MTAATTGEMCRLVVCGPQRLIEVAVPGHVAVADLLPALLHHLGEELADLGLQHGGWVLQRTGHPPLDEESSVSALGLRDGELLYLRPRSEQLPEMDFDDMIDGLADGVRDRSGRWRPEMAGWAATGLAGVALLLALVAIGLDGPAPARSAAGYLLGAASLAGALAVSRRAGESAFSTLLAAAAVGHTGLAGLILPGGPIGPGISGPQLMAGCASAAAMALVVAGLLPVAVPFFAAVTTTLLLGLAAGVAVTVGGLTGTQAAALVVVAATLLVPAVPLLAFRLAGQRLAPLPTQPEHLQEDIDPEPAAGLRGRATAADRQMTALYGGLGTAATVCLIWLGGAAGWASPLLAGLTALVWLLSARPMTSAWHRLTHAVPAVAGLVAGAVAWLVRLPPVGRLGLLLAVPFVVAALLTLARALPRRRLMPYWGRAGDLLQTTATVALLPVLLGVLGLYGFVRTIGG